MPINNLESKISAKDIKKFFSESNIKSQVAILQSDTTKNGQQIKDALYNLSAHFMKALELAASKELTAKESTKIFHDISKIGKISPALIANLDLNKEEQKFFTNFLHNFEFIRLGIFGISLDLEEISGRNDTHILAKIGKSTKYIGDPKLDINIKKLILNFNTPGGKLHDLFLANPTRFMIEVQSNDLEQDKTRQVPLHEWAYEANFLNTSGQHLVLDAIELYKDATREDEDILEKQSNYDEYIKFITENGITIKPTDINPAVLTQNSLMQLVKYKVLNDDQVIAMVYYKALDADTLLTSYKGTTLLESYCSRAKTDEAKKVVLEQVQYAIWQLDEAADKGESVLLSKQVRNMAEIALKYNILTDLEVGLLLQLKVADMQNLQDWASAGMLNAEILNNMHVYFDDLEMTLGRYFIRSDVKVLGENIEDWLAKQAIDKPESHKLVPKDRDSKIASLIESYKLGAAVDFDQLVAALKQGIAQDITERRVNDSVLKNIPLTDLSLFRKLISAALSVEDFQELYPRMSFDTLLPILLNKVPISGKYPLIALGNVGVPSLDNAQFRVLLTEMMMNTVDKDGKPVPDDYAVENGMMTLFEYAFKHNMKLSFFEDPTKDIALTKIILSAISFNINDIEAKIENAANKKERESLQANLNQQLGYLEKIAEMKSIPNTHFIKMINDKNTKAISKILTTRLNNFIGDALTILTELTATYMKAGKKVKKHIAKVYKDCKRVINEQDLKVGQKSKEFFLNLVEYCVSNTKVARNLARKTFGELTGKLHRKPPDLKVETAIQLDSTGSNLIGLENVGGMTAEEMKQSNDEIATFVKVFSCFQNLALETQERVYNALDGIINTAGNKVIESERINEIYKGFTRIITKMLRLEGPIATKALQEVVHGNKKVTKDHDPQQDANKLQDVLDENLTLRQEIAVLAAKVVELEHLMESQVQGREL